jgi:hypothetical protein
VRFRVFLPTLRIATGLLLAVLLSVVGYHGLHWRIPGSSEALLDQADEKSWVNNWIAAEPLYRQAELGFIRNHEPSKALYAHVSEIPAHSESSISVPAQLAELTADLSLPHARDTETRLRILTILGMLEVNYDSAMARATWAQVEALARQRHHYLLASRAIGEQGIAAFLLGDISTAKKNVVKAWTVAKVADPGRAAEEGNRNSGKWEFGTSQLSISVDSPSFGCDLTYESVNDNFGTSSPRERNDL